MKLTEAVNLRTITDQRGSLTVVEKIPFEIKRVYFLHHIDPKQTRGGHAHRALKRLMVAVSGRFIVRVDDSYIVLTDPTEGIFIEPMQWVELSHFSEDAVVLVLASEEHDEADCIRDYAEFLRLL